MTVVFTVAAIIGLLLVAVGAVLYLLVKPQNPTHTMLMVIGALLFAIAEEVLLLDVLF